LALQIAFGIGGIANDQAALLEQLELRLN